MITRFGPSENRIAFVNSAFHRLTGYSKRECLGRNARFLEGPETDQNTVAQISEAIAEAKSIRCEVLHYRKTGEPFWNDLSIDPLHDEAGAYIGYIGICIDATSNHMARQDMARERQRFEDITSHIPGYVYRRVLKVDGTLEHPYLSSSLNHMLELPDDAVLTTQAFLDHVHPEDREMFADRVRRSASTLSTFHLEFRLMTSRGAVRWVRCDAPPRRLPGGDVVWDGVGLDITAAKMAESEITFLASHDSLTGLSNRERFKRALGEALKAVPEGQGLGLLAVDIHRLQDINDALGQAAGDEVLRIAGQRLRTFAEGLGGTVARISSDEFGMFLPRVARAEDLSEAAQVLFANLQTPMVVNGAELAMRACIGGALFPWSDGEPMGPVDTPTELVKRAGVALRAAKRDGPGIYRAYAAGADDRVRDRVSLLHALQRAIDDGQLELHYQPLVDLGSGRIVGAEALVRWQHPQLGMQRPDQFIPLAEESGVILPLGTWVMAQAMKQARLYFGEMSAPPRISINVSGVQLRATNFIATLERALADTGADARNFELELTETSVIETSDDTRAILNRLRAMGFWITIDDFGTGHSTFKYLHAFPVDKIKIDQTFVRGLTADSNEAPIIRSMVALARGLGISIVAEGIETEFQRRFLRAEGCMIGQGYLFSPALKGEDFAWLVEREIRLPVTSRGRRQAKG
jgi:diguanylate cyclase (GGDEF)-like protein/PAS domain S-box-containing protein